MTRQTLSSLTGGFQESMAIAPYGLKAVCAPPTPSPPSHRQPFLQPQRAAHLPAPAYPQALYHPLLLPHRMSQPHRHRR